jgi:hypothetical protein
VTALTLVFEHLTGLTPGHGARPVTVVTVGRASDPEPNEHDERGQEP